MCRIFGFRSVIQSKVHTSLVNADNALGFQSSRHPDGWGVAYYLEHSPHIIRSKDTALEDRLFQKVSGIVSSQTVIAHIRNATQGTTSVLNTHPFQYGPWTFAHNGHIKNFDQVKDKILKDTSPHLSKFILGDTDSELVFYFILSELDKKLTLSCENVSHQAFLDVISEAIKKLIQIIGECNFDSDEIQMDHNYLTFVLTNGKYMAAHQGGQPLYYSTYKKHCPERDTCPAFAPFCEAPPTDGMVNHLVFSSEPVSDDNIWIPMSNHDLISVNSEMSLLKTSV